MSKHWTVTARRTGVSDARLEARFQWQKDRFAHQIVLVVGDADQWRLAQSLEGDDQQDFPPSPPLQDMSVEQRVGSQVALGVGMAGSAMWSLSVEAEAEGGGLLFDWACQTRGSLIWPKNCYSCSSDDRAANSTPAEVLLGRFYRPDSRWIEVVLTLEQTPATLPLGYKIADQEVGVLTNPLLAVNDSTRVSVLEIEGCATHHAPEFSRTGTLRWQYRIAMRTGVE